MSNVTAPLFSLTAKKTFAKTLTFQKRKGTHVVYLANKPGSVSHFVPSEAQNEQRAVIGSLVSSWHSLVPRYKHLWDDEAKRIFYCGTGYHLFIHTGGSLNLTFTWASLWALWADPDVSWIGV